MSSALPKRPTQTSRAASPVGIFADAGANDSIYPDAVVAFVVLRQSANELATP